MNKSYILHCGQSVVCLTNTLTPPSFNLRCKVWQVKTESQLDNDDMKMLGEGDLISETQQGKRVSGTDGELADRATGTSLISRQLF